MSTLTVEWSDPAPEELQRVEEFAKGKVAFVFPTLYQGWECDPRGYVVDISESEKVLVLTSHGSPFMAENLKLVELIATYREAILLTQTALNRLLTVSTDADEILALVHRRIGGGVDIVTMPTGTVQVHWRRYYGDAGWSDQRYTSHATLSGALARVLQHEDEADEADAAEAGEEQA